MKQLLQNLKTGKSTVQDVPVPAPRKGQALVKRRPQEPVSELQAELSRLRQENARLKVEKEILKKAAAYFAKELM